MRRGSFGIKRVCAISSAAISKGFYSLDSNKGEISSLNMRNIIFLQIAARHSPNLSKIITSLKGNKAIRHCVWLHLLRAFDVAVCMMRFRP